MDRHDNLENPTSKLGCITIKRILGNTNSMSYFLGVLTEITKWYGIGQKRAGLLQTVFVVAYMVFAPIFGYLGDRFPRKYVMAFGITIWSGTTFACSLMGRTVNIIFEFFEGL